MELIIVIIIVLAICFILNVPAYYMMLGAGIVLFVITTLFAVGVVVATAILLCSKRSPICTNRSGEGR